MVKISKRLAIAICEDETYILEELRKKAERYIKKRRLTANIKTYTSGEELLKESAAFDIILLDLRLPGLNGMEVAKQISGKSPIIFITSYQEYALEAFEVEAVHYLLKPVTDERLYVAMDRAIRRSKQVDDQTLTLTKAGEAHVILVCDILYCEVLNHRVSIHTAQGTFDYFGTLDVLETRLDERFFRCHRSFIVNMSCVAGQEKGTAVLTNGEQIMISRRKQSEFMKSLLEFLKNEVI